MTKHKHGAVPGPQQQTFLDFIQRVSPDVDPTNVRLFGLFMKTRHQLAHAAEEELSEVGLTWAKLRLLMHLAKQEYLGADAGVQPSELSEMQEISRNTVSALINGLEAEGLVTRELHGSDRRKLVIRLTPQGRAILKDQMINHLRFVGHCFDVFDSQERDTLCELLSRLDAHLKEGADMPPLNTPCSSGGMNAGKGNEDKQG